MKEGKGVRGVYADGPGREWGGRASQRTPNHMPKETNSPQMILAIQEFCRPKIQKEVPLL